VIEDAKDWVRERAGKVLVCSTGTLLALSLIPLGSALLGNGSADAEAKADQLIVELQGDLETAENELKATHARLLADLPGLDAERADRDRVTARSVLLSLIGPSSSTRGLAETQASLDARYEFLSTTSRVLTEFIPEWMAATGSGHGSGTTYRLVTLGIDVTEVRGLDYSYAGVARFDPVTADGESTAKREYVIFTFRTRQDCSVSAFEAYRASSRTRDLLVAQKPDDTAAAVMTPTPRAKPAENG
jgi:hypothetical protein